MKKLYLDAYWACCDIATVVESQVWLMAHPVLLVVPAVGLHFEAACVLLEVLCCRGTG